MTDDVPATRSVADWRAAIRGLAPGDHLGRIDLATRGLHEHPDALALQHARLLAFARAGAGRAAATGLAELRRGGRLDGLADPFLRGEFAALAARLLKDRAMAAAPADLAPLAAAAGASYEDAWRRFGGSYPAINAATLWRIAGDADRATALARAALAAAATTPEDYWTLATVAEARALLGDDAAAAAALRAAVAAGADGLDDIAATRRQLGWLARLTGLGAGALVALPTPLVVHWLTDPSGDADADIALPADILAAAGAGHGLLAHGSVLAPADLAVAEALLRHGAALQLVLPCAAELCRDALARRGGPAAAARFDRLLAAAKARSDVTLEGDPEEITVLRLALLQARGHALLRGAHLSAPVRVLAVAAGRAALAEPPPGAADLDRFLAAWPYPDRDGSVWSGRRARALVFGDVKGFSSIAEARHPAFLRVVIGGFADALAALGAGVEYAETAGDGLYVVLSDVVLAARACRALHRVVAPERLRAAGLPERLALRLSAHVGPVFRGRDRVIGRERFFGKEVIRTSRIEPVTPPGETYVTEQFAAALRCAAGDYYACEYVGDQPMAKEFGKCRMYSLRDAGDRPAAPPDPA
jgi:hypothetical protein